MRITMHKLTSWILAGLLALCVALPVQAGPTSPRPLNEAEKRIVSAFSVFKTDGSYDAVNVRFSDAIENDSLVFASDKLGEGGYIHCSTRIDTEKGHVEYAWSKGAGDHGKGVGLINDNVWIAEVSAGTEVGQLAFLKNGKFVGAQGLYGADATAIMEAGHERLFFELQAVVSAERNRGTADGFSKDTMQRMGTFVSNFTEAGMWNLQDAQNLTAGQYIAFGIRHEWINNRKRFKMGNDNMASIEASHIENAVTRYFGKAFTAHCAVPDKGIQYDPTSKRYTIPMADGEMTTHASVEIVTRNGDGTLVMYGTLYNAEDTSDTFGPFTAKAKPHKWNGKDTWALLSLECLWTFNP